MEVFFSRPGKKGEIKERIITDIKYARKQVLISVYSFSSAEIAEVINDSKALDKRIVYDKDVDLRKMVNKYNKDTKQSYEAPLIEDENFIKENCASLGKSYSKMHHKFIITDDVLWTGTYNLSFNAHSNNWENMMRISEKDVVRKFIEEFDKMFVFSKAINDKLNLNKCTCCNDDVEDPFEHYRIAHITAHLNHITIKKESSAYYDESTQKIVVSNDDVDLGAFEIRNGKDSTYTAECLKEKENYEWAECCKCKEKGIKSSMHKVSQRFKNRVRVNKENEQKIYDSELGSFKKHPDQITCLNCLHSIIIEASKLNIPNLKEELPIHHHY
ncbi:phospholipase D-like domain-containing protein [Priestia megaterium]|uniref:phospholipase D-like domain-containing protein n=1 Tax=Priestia megaterium TaxID=1404 RepID=UPI00387A1A27